MNKYCHNCKSEKALTEFFLRNKQHPEQGHRSICKNCEREKSRIRMSKPGVYAKRLEKLRKYRSECTLLEKPTEGTLVCKACKVEKPIDAFHKDKGVPTGRNTRCKECVLRRLSQTYYKFAWGIDPEVVSQKLSSQHGCCKICGKEAKLVLDHNHNSHAIRDLLCNNCNSGLGYFQDDEQILRNALSYLENHRLNPSDIRADPSLIKRRKWERDKPTR